MTGTWPLSWGTGDLMQATEFKKGIGCIFDSTLGGSAANVDVTSISGTYAHLLVIAYTRSDTALTTTGLSLRFNGDTAANYDYQTLAGNTTTVSASETFAQTAVFSAPIPANTAGANLFGVALIFIPHYAGTSNNKAALTLSYNKIGATTGSLTNNLRGGFWRSSAAITQVTLLPAAGNFVAGTRVSVYGMGA